MATKQITRNIALTAHFDRFVQSNVESGRQEIELGWQQSEQGEMTDGPAVFAEIRKISRIKQDAGRAKR